MNRFSSFFRHLSPVLLNYLLSTEDMKVTRSLFAILTLVRAAYLQRPRNPEAFWVAKQMAVSEQVDHVGWSPVPTPAPGVAKDNEIVLDVLKRQIATTSLTGWVNAQTCGWYAEYVCKYQF